MKIILPILCCLFLPMCAFADSEAASASRLSLLNFEGFGSMAFQSIPGAGHSFAGGAHYTPNYRLSDLVAIKGIFGAQTFKSTASTGSKVYVVLDYLAAAQLDFFKNISINVGGGAGTDLRSSGKTCAAALLGGQYAFAEKKLLGFFDNTFLTGHYYFNSSKLWVIHYGLGINL